MKAFNKLLSISLAIYMILCITIFSYAKTANNSTNEAFSANNYSGASIEEIQHKLNNANLDIDASSIKMDSQEFIDAHTKQSNSTTYRTLPTIVDNTSYFPSASSTGQGNQGSCTAWAMTYFLKSGQEIINKGWSRNTTNHIFSPAYVFNTTTNNGAGITLGQAALKMFSSGVCPLSYMPYNASDYAKQPTEIQNAAAELYTIGDFWFTGNITEMKEAIYVHGGVCVSVLLYEDFYNISSTNQIYDTIDLTDTDPEYHSLCIIGYDDSKQAFKFVNSWRNDSFGINGYGWISYNLINNPNVNLPGAGVSCVIEYQDNNVVMGDVNRDGTVTAQDAVLTNKYLRSTATLTATQLVLADVDGDGHVDSSDSQNILNFSSQSINQLPIYN